MKKKIIVSFFFLLLVGCGPQSRTISRLTGIPTSVKLPEDCVKVISVSISSENKNSSKNVTYINTEGDLITKEFTDWGLWQGSIKWVRHDGSSYAKKITPEG